MKKIFCCVLAVALATVAAIVAIAATNETPSPPINATVVSQFQAQDAATTIVTINGEVLVANPQTNVVEIRPVIDRVALAPLTATTENWAMTSRTTSTATVPTWTRSFIT